MYRGGRGTRRASKPSRDNLAEETAKSIGYALVKYASREYPDFEFEVVIKEDPQTREIRVWVEREGEAVIDGDDME